MGFKAFSWSDLYDATATHLAASEDGFLDFPGVIEGYAFYVVVENDKGARWIHRHSFLAPFASQKEEQEARSQALADRVQARLDAGGNLDQDRWFEGRPAYGSEAYVENDQGRKDLFDELQDARDAGEDVRDEDFVRHGVADLG